MSGAASVRWRRPPNTMSAAPIRPRAATLKPSMPSSPMPTIASQRGNAAVSGAIGSGSGMAGTQARILILGGTAEARNIGATPGAAAPILPSRCRSPAVLPRRRRKACRFASAASAALPGSRIILIKERIDALIDATHPYADTISANAAAAARGANVPFIALRRPPWTAVAGDRWTEVKDAGDAVRALGQNSRRVLVALGRQELAPLTRCAAAFLSDPQRRSGRSAACSAA